MSDSDLIKLYSKQILNLAAAIPHLGTLDAPDGEAKARSPLCGSSVSVGLTQTDGAVTGFAQSVKACALGQASAAILGNQVIGLDRATLQRGRDQLNDMLTKQGPVPTAPFERYEVLQPAREFTNRHASILLPFDATLAAIDAADRA
ncbi:iron-sulfur cluster assembly scaffold protein [Aliiroseovarius sediminis]|uniref:iron-sulfur cluster assembly scaffold protein n=1 Tax=Aliiroseovarius sediminis TaxID=2925839 RepID=UPI001F5894A5|nr:iron-sulfur cluster assembly scaffold protein [Aliiroseovarius sediminis]MCI2393228.1 iron-sulfur cluster assembly scaffold protein [Aliiroseovarius sediminis]